MAAGAGEALDESATGCDAGGAFAADRILTFPHGLIGFPDARRFALLASDRPASPFRSLACLDVPGLRFVVCEPASVGTTYGPELRAEDAAVLVIVTVPGDGRPMTANLMAPLVVDGRTGRGRQVVLDGGCYSTRHPLPSAPGP